MQRPTYLDLDAARDLLAEMGVPLNDRQIRRAAEKDAYGNRKLPFFVDPIDGRLKIERSALIRTYYKAQMEAEQHLRL
ncbi:hypothetical protein [Rhodospira trueperi]|uniref:Uncharacterized protein n=1 Tax=Rhodospira trueperi TaxID=69960 RepID=A0A1G7HHX4_9PROT|nr:hypothetical protein [Rhodospira trueperi]SDE99951.1 hypothetical protein SAMN05421720_12120 [Rhodospira trueperi]